MRSVFWPIVLSAKVLGVDATREDALACVGSPRGGTWRFNILYSTNWGGECERALILLRQEEDLRPHWREVACSKDLQRFN